MHHAVERVQQARRLQPRPRPRVQRQHDRPRHPGQHVHQRPQPGGIVDVARAVRGGQQVRAARDARAARARAKSARGASSSKTSTITSPDHHHLADDLLLAQRLGRGGRRAQQQRRRVVGQHAVELLRHPRGRRSASRPPRARPESRPARPPAPPPASSSCRRRPARRPAPRTPAAAPAPSSIRAVCAVFVPPPRSRRCSGRGSSELVEEHPRERVVVVLAGVDQHLLGHGAQPVRDGRGLDELGAVADDGEDAHRESCHAACYDRAPCACS